MAILEKFWKEDKIAHHGFNWLARSMSRLEIGIRHVRERENAVPVSSTTFGCTGLKNSVPS